MLKVIQSISRQPETAEAAEETIFQLKHQTLNFILFFYSDHYDFEEVSVHRFIITSRIRNV
ncbi:MULTISPECIES: hypothetical protein [unclassified Paenibacillus]|uniref:hypothetical protein n=1 Tax=unclassified Paenibacillus TaxID=185978 RepID=UPI00277EE371|nr:MULTISPECIES: hypothetical protein [unclassified Paenibacillus]MDQ0903460.1 hypothetical protein [Paenibacillus sp. V4I7]MDQ0918062.1 hypothetical protein [Paenibacillus sp. V4I5]